MKIVCLFPGQGSYEPQYFLDHENQANHIESVQGQIVYQSFLAWEAIKDHLQNHQILLCGHSLGELSALGLSNSWSLETLISVATQREHLMSEISKAFPDFEIRALIGSLDIEKTQSYCLKNKDWIWMMNINSAEQIVVAYLKTHSHLFSKLLEECSIKKSILINMNVLSHIPALEGAQQPFRHLLQKTLQQYPNHELKEKVFSTFLKTIDSNKHMYCEGIVLQLASQVDFLNAIIKIEELFTPDLYIEIGPKNILSNLMKKNSTIKCMSTNSQEALFNTLTKIGYQS